MKKNLYKRSIKKWTPADLAKHFEVIGFAYVRAMASVMAVEAIKVLYFGKLQEAKKKTHGRKK